jgi:hypothetical protein
MLYRAAWRAVKALGYRKLITYTLPEEGGASLRASGLRSSARLAAGVGIGPVGPPPTRTRLERSCVGSF